MPKVVVADLKRRVKHPTSVDIAAIKKLEPAARIAKLIDAMDEIGATQSGQPGGIHWMGDPISQALADEDDAVLIPALIDAIEFDRRVTRSVSFGRDFFPERTIHPVSHVARQILNTVWKTNSGGAPSLLRAEWSKQGGDSEAVRLLKILRDDTRPPLAWSSAAETLLRTSGRRKQGEPLVTLAETIRKSHGEEITSLLAKRALQMAATNVEGSGTNLFYAADGLRLAEALYQWDPRASLPTLVKACDLVLSTSAVTKDRENDVAERVAAPFAAIISARITLGDKTAAAAFEKLYALSPNLVPFQEQAYRPFFTAKGQPEFEAIAAKFYARLEQEFASEANAKSRLLTAISDLCQTQILAVPSFRAFLARSIGDTNYCGVAEFAAGTQSPSVRYRVPRGMSGMRGITGVDESQCLTTEQTFSVGDWVAQMLNWAKGAPAFAIAMKPDVRADARKRVQTWLLDPAVDWKAVTETLPFRSYWD